MNAKLYEAFFQARHRADTEAAIDFVFSLGFEAGVTSARAHKDRVQRAKHAVRNKRREIVRRERIEAARARRGDAVANRERVIRETAAPVLEAVARHYEMSVRALLQRCSPRKVSAARNEACWLLREVKEMSFEAIATATERDDHTTAMHAVARVEARIVERPELRGELLGLVAGASGMRATG